MLRIKEVEMVDSFEELKSSRSIDGKMFPNIETGCEDCACSEQDHPKFPLQEKDRSRGTEKAQKEDWFA